MNGHELVEQLAAVVLVTSGTTFLAAGWLARRGVLRDAAAVRIPNRSRASVVRSIAVVPIVGIVGVTALLVAASVITDVPDHHHDSGGAVVTDHHQDIARAPVPAQ